MKHYLFAFLTSVIVSAVFVAAFYPVVNKPITLNAQKTANTRYFLVGYKGGNVTGYYSFWNTQFPSAKSMGEDIKKLCKDDHSWTITFIYEFKNEQDFNNFRK